MSKRKKKISSLLHLLFVPQEAMQQWYQHYQAAQANTYSTAAPPDGTASDFSKEHTQVNHTSQSVMKCKEKLTVTCPSNSITCLLLQ